MTQSLALAGATIIARNGPLTGAVDGKKGIIAVGVKINAGPDKQAIFADTQDRFSFGRNKAMTLPVPSPAGAFALKLNAAGGGTRLYMFTSAYPNSESFHRLLISVDMDNQAACQIYVDDVPDFSVGFFQSAVLDYTDTNWAIGANPGGSDKLNGCLGPLVVKLGAYEDFSVEANRRKYWDSAGHWCYDVSTDPTTPIVYQLIPDGGTAEDFLLNRGTGGDFANYTKISTGPIAICSDNP